MHSDLKCVSCPTLNTFISNDFVADGCVLGARGLTNLQLLFVHFLKLTQGCF
jgi:hypothetical protein